MDLLKLHLYAKSKKGGGSGGGGAEGETDQLAAIVDGSITVLNDNKITSLRSFACSCCENLESVNLSAITVLGANAFANCPKLTEVRLQEVVELGEYVFSMDGALTQTAFPKVTTVYNFAFNNSGVEILDFPSLTQIYPASFSSAKKLSTLLLRNEETVCVLRGTAAFNGTPIAKGTGYIYVPAALLDQYAAATNWSDFGAQFRALEDFTVDGTITGALDESKI